MTWPVDDIYLLDNTPQHNWGPRPATDGVILHTTEGSGPTRTDALATAQWQQSNPGSYNFIIYDADSAGSKGGVLLTIPYKEACGGINPASPYWNPEPWLKDLLPARAFADPTMYHLQLSFSGKAAALSAGKYPDNMIVTAARLIKWAEESDWAADNLVVSAHAHWQDNRSDPGAGVLDRVLDAYEQLSALPDTGTTDPVADLTEKLAACRKKRNQLRRRLEAAEQKIIAAQEALGGTP